MTKEDLEEMCKYPPRNQEEAMFIEAISQFLARNIVTPRGENRSPYADIIHAYAEGETIQYSEGDGYYDLSKPNFDGAGEYRIKPSEPTFEWQWVLVRDGKIVRCDSDDWFTEDGVKGKGNWIKIEETKRIRL